MIDSIETIVKNLSVNHRERLEKNPNNDSSTSLPFGREDVEDVLDIIKKNVRPENVEDIYSGIEKLVKDGENVFETGGNVVPKLGGNNPVPLIYDALLTIFFNTNQLERQYHFHNLLDIYYDNIKEYFNRDEFEDQVSKFIPYIKLEMIKFSSGDENKTALLESISELIELILYPQILRENCYKIVENKLETVKYEFIKYEIFPINARIGFLGDYYRLNITIKHRDEEENIRCFVKFMPITNETTKQIAGSTFVKEIFFYKDFIQILRSLGVNDILDFLPACYLTKHNDYLILEDLSYQNYASKSMDTPADYGWLLLATKQLAKLHACSFIYEEKMSKEKGEEIRIGNLFKPFLKEYIFDKSDVAGTVLLVGSKTTVSYLLDKFPDITKDFDMTKLKEKVTNAFEEMYKNVQQSDKLRNVICHGDYWGANILTKWDENNEAESCVLVDFQMIRYCPPALELMFLLYLNTDQTTRKSHEKDLLHNYFYELKDILARYDVDINDIFEYDTFLRSCDYYRLTAICIVCTYIQICFVPNHVINPLNANPEKAEAYYAGDRTEVLDLIMKHYLFSNKARETIDDLCCAIKNVAEE